MKKWTDCYGAIRQVTVWTDDRGRFTGYDSAGHGACWSEPLDELPPGQFFDTAEEAVAAARQRLLTEAERLQVVLNYLTEEVNHLELSVGAALKRAGNLESEVVR